MMPPPRRDKLSCASSSSSTAASQGRDHHRAAPPHPCTLHPCCIIVVVILIVAINQEDKSRQRWRQQRRRRRRRRWRRQWQRTAGVRNPQGISKLVNKVDFRVPRALLKAIVQAFFDTKSFAAGSSTYPCHMACILKSVPRDVISLSNYCPQWHGSAVDVTRNSQGLITQHPFLTFLRISCVK
jgi:hypothetical protein